MQCDSIRLTDCRRELKGFLSEVDAYCIVSIEADGREPFVLGTLNTVVLCEAFVCGTKYTVASAQKLVSRMQCCRHVLTTLPFLVKKTVERLFRMSMWTPQPTVSPAENLGPNGSPCRCKYYQHPNTSEACDGFKRLTPTSPDL